MVQTCPPQVWCTSQSPGDVVKTTDHSPKGARIGLELPDTMEDNENLLASVCLGYYMGYTYPENNYSLLI